MIVPASLRKQGAHDRLHRQLLDKAGGPPSPKPIIVQCPPALYMFLSVMTALREANQAGSLQPTALVSYNADIDGVLDSRDDAALKAEGMDAVMLAERSWRDQMKMTGEAETQAFAGRLAAAGYIGLVVNSFAPGATGADLNLVLWTWSATATCRLTLINDEDRLSQ